MPGCHRVSWRMRLLACCLDASVTGHCQQAAERQLAASHPLGFTCCTQSAAQPADAPCTAAAEGPVASLGGAERGGCRRACSGRHPPPCQSSDRPCHDGCHGRAQVLQQAMRHEMAEAFFNEPVDAVALGIPDYHEVIKVGCLHMRGRLGTRSGGTPGTGLYIWAAVYRAHGAAGPAHRQRARCEARNLGRRAAFLSLAPDV